jgi:Holliday junction resolvase
MSDDFEDYDVDNILVEKRRKVDGGKKGKRTERNLVAILSKRFGEGFSRSLGSGNRWGQVAHLPKHAKDTLTGDLCCPKGFKFVIESKGGYKNVDLNAVFMHGNTELDGFLDQVSKDSKRCQRKPMLVWKQDRKPWLVFVHTQELKGHHFKYRLQYGKWSCVALDHLLKLPDDFFIEAESDPLLGV